MICDLRNTDLFPPRTRICVANSCQHARWFMSVFLLKSDGSTSQNIFFNVFIILKYSINRENNTLQVVVVPQLQRPMAGVGLFPTSLILVNICKVGKVRQSRNLLDPFTAHRYDAAWWWAKWHDASYDVEQIGYPVSLRRVSTALKIAMKPPKPKLSQWKSELNDG